MCMVSYKEHWFIICLPFMMIRRLKWREKLHYETKCPQIIISAPAWCGSCHLTGQSVSVALASWAIQVPLKYLWPWHWCSSKRFTHPTYKRSAGPPNKNFYRLTLRTQEQAFLNFRQSFFVVSELTNKNTKRKHFPPCSSRATCTTSAPVLVRCRPRLRVGMQCTSGWPCGKVSYWPSASYVSSHLHVV